MVGDLFNNCLNKPSVNSRKVPWKIYVEVAVLKKSLRRMFSVELSEIFKVCLAMFHYFAWKDQIRNLHLRIAFLDQ